MQTKNIIWFIFIFMLSGLFSCKEIETYSPIPEITYKDFLLSEEILYDTSALHLPYIGGTLVFEFRDGNGDFGFLNCDDKNDTTYNIYITQLEKRDGIYYSSNPEDSSSQNYNQKICYDEVMDRSGQNKLIQGKIEILFLYALFDHPSFDTIEYSFYITDQAKNKSNTELTDEIIINWDSFVQ